MKPLTPPPLQGARILTVCGHTFCDECITRIAQDRGMASRCPLCRQEYAPAHILSLAQLKLQAKPKEEAAEGDAVAVDAAREAPAAPAKVRRGPYSGEKKLRIESIRVVLADTPGRVEVHS